MVPNEGYRQAVYVQPAADVSSTDVGYVIRAEMPGVEKDALEITVEHGELIILGRSRNLVFANGLRFTCNRQSLSRPS
jgi:HSP20 family molecular chaperone IbpA